MIENNGDNNRGTKRCTEMEMTKKLRIIKTKIVSMKMMMNQKKQIHILRILIYKVTLC